jgi:hypothetical protein
MQPGWRNVIDCSNIADLVINVVFWPTVVISFNKTAYAQKESVPGPIKRKCQHKHFEVQLVKLAINTIGY